MIGEKNVRNIASSKWASLVTQLVKIVANVCIVLTLSSQHKISHLMLSTTI